MKALRQYLEMVGHLSEEDIQSLLAFVRFQKLKKGDFFIREGQVSIEVGFLVSGLIRSYYTTNTGEEITYCFRFPNDMIAAYSSFITGNKTDENLQAISEVELLVFSKQELNKLSNDSLNWTKFLKEIAELQYIELEKRIFQLQKTTALQRYEDLLQNQPEYVQKIPLQYLASYLGITQRHLSRIRKEFVL
ncbi:Crp/Fnr family transcriptional regulator [Flavihumibacter sp. RY-1]|uniref:Crp/Fnr family transcriptional regulator n=1 Tax=Flavihumibacter fluminis TaxID=2909236 RepID=A0ABS9BDC9_9BACT|nr:Crp/Fnr family transcriptional regulator [Flavihumibacter fluminis]MCF1713567.1 Crp/Fnr family transcriptional regulator [Flavihumibacter fluminis]